MTEKTKNIAKTKKTKNNVLPILITRSTVMFPGSVITTEVGREKSINSIMYSIEKCDGYLLVVSQINHNVDNPTFKDIYLVGTINKVRILKKEDDGSLVINLTCLERIKINALKLENGDYGKYYVASYEDYVAKKLLNKEHMEILKSHFEEIWSALESSEHVYFAQLKKVLESDKIDGALYVLCTLSKGTTEEKQMLLEETDNNKLLRKALLYSIPKAAARNIDDDINKIMNKNLSKQQKEFYLREKIRTIKKELGDITTKEDDAERIRERVKEYEYPEHIKKRILAEVNRLESASSSNEGWIIKVYLDWLLNLPYVEKTEDNNDLENVISILNKNHYGLEKVKERIIEYIAVLIRSRSNKGSIICLLGPPGVGKTSLAKSIAEALNKKFCKISLGGMRDEAELKGHRKTYLGSMPGRIIKEIEKIGVINPLFLLDEIDKLVSDSRGDPASTLLDILDIEQNSKFSDNYLEEDYDLSNVLFMTTANYEENIPPALRDRLEIIRLDSYTENEKISICIEHLIPKILNEYKLTENDLKFTLESVEYIIRYYTREAGVREAERKIREIARKFIVNQLKNNIASETINIPEVKKYLKKEIFDHTNKDEIAIPGVVNGMAYTAFGGDLLPIEVNYSKGKGKINITGNLKETMKESAAVAAAFVRANAEKYEIKQDFSEIDLHIHVPSGGIPKDGPSAGVTLTTALISCLKSYPVPTNLAMTGEITLRGKVLIIGGVKEKTISAFRGGVTEILIPKDDEKYIDDIPKEILSQINITLISHYDQIYNMIFNKK